MKFVLTGLSGMIGSCIADAAAEKGHVMLRPPPGEVPQWSDPLTGAAEPDLASPEFAAWVAGSGADAVVHAGAVVGSHRAHLIGARLTLRSNVLGTYNVARAAAEAGAHLVYFASESEYDPRSYGEGSPIDIARTPYGPRSMYGASKLAARVSLQRSGLRDDQLSVIHPCFGYGGPEDSMTCCGAILRHLAFVPGYERPALQLDPTRVKDMTYHADIAAMALACAEGRIHGDYVAASGDPATLMGFVGLAESVAGHRVDLAWAGHLDYKGDMYFAKEDVERSWSAVGLAPTDRVEAVSRELSLYSEMLSRGIFPRPHVWGGMESLADAAGAE